MKKTIRIVFILLIPFSMFLFSSCDKELDSYYAVPKWLKGNAYEMLKKNGDYSLFLEAVELAGYKDVISGKGIITVMAPDNAAVNSYLSSNSYGSVKDIPSAELKKLVGFHLVYYSFDKGKFANYNPDGFTTEIDWSDAGLNYKFRTKSSSAIEEYSDVTEDGKLKKVYHKERFLPVFSSYIFDSKGIDATLNYQYFYPNTTWDGQDGGFCVSNANVVEYALVTDNGYVYTINSVLEPLETIHKALEKTPEFSMFKSLYDKFSDFQYDAGLTEDYGNGDSLFLYYHSDLPKIASEWSYNGEGSMKDYEDLEQLSRLTNNLFAPSNSALTSFYDSFWSGYYSSIDEVGFLPIKYLLDNHVYEGDIVFPEEIAKGVVTSKYGSTIEFNTEEVSVREICANGTFYGLDNISVPKMFESVTAPLFQDPKYRIFLHMMDQADLVQSFMSEDVDVKVFMPTDQTLIDNTTINGSMLMYQNTNPKKYGEQILMVEGSDIPWVPMSSRTMEGIVKNHIASKLMTTIGNQKIYKTLNPFQYLLVEDDNKVYSSYIFNNYPDSPAPFKLNSERFNGEAYDLTGETEVALIEDNILFQEQFISNTPENFTYFKDILGAAEYLPTSVTEEKKFRFWQGDRFIVLVPSNQVIEANFTKIPLTIEDGVQPFIKNFFVKVNESSLNDYPFPGAGIQGELETFGGSKLTLIDAGDKLQIKDAKGNVVNIVGVFPNIYSEGAMYEIDGILELE